MLNGKVIIFHLIAGLIKKILYKMDQNFLNHIIVLVEVIKLSQVCLILQQKLI